ncbi:ceramide synthase 2-like [Chiloscyllium plagiosum]|uniref:ceramide synthase 2-like n=1 Tax=Chiloscyllium plagiosum TaxID=36176 RepID=UPI001CB7BC8F|nr:ceramide synthase 2-like [Chiloscyllium plagiosum]
MFRTIYDWFWWDRLWLPYNLTWTDLEDRDGRIYAKASDLYVTIPCAFVFMIIRYLFERTIATYFARALGIKEKVRLRVKPNPILEKSFRASSKHPKQVGPAPPPLLSLSLLHSNGGKPRGGGWRDDILVGFLSMGDKLQGVKEGRVRGRPEGVCSCCWLTEFWRRACSLKLTNFCLDQSAKMFNYAGWKKTCNCLFILFAVAFILTRLVIFPFWIIHCTVIYPLELYPAFFGYYFFNAILVVLQLLHIFWAALILRMTLKFMTGNIVEDERSDRDETDNSEDEEEELVKNGLLSNGHSMINNNHGKSD